MVKELEIYISIKFVSNSLSTIHYYIPPAPLKGGVTEWYQAEWRKFNLSILITNMIVQRYPIPPLREVRESGVCEGDVVKSL